MQINPVLCMSYDALQEQGVYPTQGCHLYEYDFSKIDPKHIHLLNRSICDSKAPEHAYIAEVLPQVLPYCVVRCGDEYLTYSRAKGAETRLHGSLSLGFGGHIDLVDVVDGKVDLLKALHRELEEELQLKNHDYQSYDIVTTTRILVDTTNPVGKVHIGFLYELVLENKAQVNPDPAEIHLPVWKSVTDLQQEYTSYENWSSTLINMYL